MRKEKRIDPHNTFEDHQDSMSYHWYAQSWANFFHRQFKDSFDAIPQCNRIKQKIQSYTMKFHIYVYLPLNLRPLANSPLLLSLLQKHASCRSIFSKTVIQLKHVHSFVSTKSPFTSRMLNDAKCEAILSYIISNLRCVSTHIEYVVAFASDRSMICNRC